MTTPRTQRRLAAILAADIVGYSRLVASDEAGTLAVLREVWDQRFDPAVAAHGGRIVKKMGDGALVEFASAVDAVDCAVAVQRAMTGFNEARQDQPIEFRIGINLGDIVIDGEDILGDGVNVAARLEAEAPRGGVLVSDSIHAQVAGKSAISFADRGPLTLKNIAAPVRAWSWRDGKEPHAEMPQEPATPTDQPSIAVLPFDAMSGDPDQEFFADGLVEDIITTLSKLSGLRVIARNSTFAYKGQSVDVRNVARDLGVRFVMEGSVRQSGNRIRITVQLIDATTGSHVWAERYDRSFDDIFAVQDEITLVLATEMQVKLTEGEQARLRYQTTTNVEAWTYWVKGLAYFRKPVTKENAALVLENWKKALELDPDSATLNAMASIKHWSDARFGWWDDRETALAKARVYVDRALEIDAESPDASIMHSLILLVEGAYDDAVTYARKAARLAPGSADVATFACFVLAFAGHASEAVGHGKQAMDLSPHHPDYYLGILGNAYRLSGRLSDAIPTFQAFHQRAPGFGLTDLVLIHQQNGNPDQAQELAGELLSIRQDFTISDWEKTQFRADKAGLADDVAALSAAGLPMD
ncbi:MAG: adenylate/guanylate cyclase domain-containing protein [Paracoccaceae bacterium]|nr:adenylate/guanylate cyclase domain-containing protein [Paracoccaceae bacterium]